MNILFTTCCFVLWHWAGFCFQRLFDIELESMGVKLGSLLRIQQRKILLHVLLAGLMNVTGFAVLL